MKQQRINNKFTSTGNYIGIPSKPGVYIVTGTGLGSGYIGSSINLKKRAISHKNQFGFNGGDVDFKPLMYFDKISKHELRVIEYYYINLFGTRKPSGLNIQFIDTSNVNVDYINSIISNGYIG